MEKLDIQVESFNYLVYIKKNDAELRHGKLSSKVSDINSISSIKSNKLLELNGVIRRLNDGHSCNVDELSSSIDEIKGFVS